MNLQQIKQAVNDGKVVCWKNDNYLVEKGGPTGFIVVFQPDERAMFVVNERTDCDEFFIIENHL